LLFRYYAVLLAVISIVCLNAVAAEPSEDEIRQSLQMCADIFNDCTPSASSIEEESEQTPMPVQVTPEQFKAAAAKFQKSFYFWPSESSDSEINVLCDPFHVPYREFSSGLLRWKSATTAAANDLLDSKSNKHLSFQKIPYFSAPDVFLKSKSAKSIKKLAGVLKLRHPAAIVTAELPINSINKETKIGDARCKLLAVENNMAVIWCDEKSPPMEAYLFSPSGSPLVVTHSVKGAYSFYKETVHGKKIPAKVIEKFVKSPDDLDKEGSAYVYIAKGTIAKVVVIVAGETVIDSFPVVAFPLPKFGETCPAIPSPRYAAQAVSLGFAEFDAGKVKKETVVRSGRSEDNDPMILISPPRCGNAYFADAKVKDLFLTKGSKTVEFDPQGPFRNDDGAGFHFRMDPANGGKRIEFDIAKGTVELKFPLKIVSQRIEAGATDTPVVINGCKVIVYDTSFVFDSKSPRPQVRAYDAAGGPLLFNDTYNLSGADDKGSFRQLQFWGTVAYVEIDRVLLWATVAIPLSLKPAPPVKRQEE
jgi:hypothetical protein